PVTIPSIVTAQAEGISASSATLSGRVSDDGGAAISERGVVWSLRNTPTLSDHKRVHGSSDTGAFSLTATLPAGRTIYARAYATNSQGTSFGNEISFNTPAASVPGNALRLNGSNTQVVLNSAASAATDFGGSSFTLEAWINP